MTRSVLLAALATFMLIAPDSPRAAEPAAATPAQTVALPKPDLQGKVTLEKLLSQRRSAREYAPGALALQEVAQLMWAAQGITSPDGKRTTPSARAVYPLEVYVLVRHVIGLPAGVYRYEPKDHALFLVSPGDHSEAIVQATPRQAAVAAAPLVIVVTGDSVRAADKFGARAERWTAMETGFVVQDVYLEATALGLGTVMVGGFEGSAVHRALDLPAGRELFALMPVGRKK